MIFKEALNSLKHNKNYLLLALSFTFNLGNINTIGTLINQFLYPYGFNDTQTGVIGALFIFLGLFGGIVTGIYV